MKRVLLWLLLVGPISSFAAMFYVWPGSPSPAAPFGTWGTAAHTIQEAVDAASAGDVVVVTNGVYNTGGRFDGSHSNRVSIYKPVVVQSVNGPGATLIVGASHAGGFGPTAARGVYVGAGALISGFRITNGFTAAALEPSFGKFGGGAFVEAGGTISNCVVTGNSARIDGGGIAGVSFFSSKAFNCIISNNSAGDDGGGVDSALVYNSIISHNTAADDGGGVDDSFVYNSVLRQNTAIEQGGGGFESGFSQCTITENSARRGGGVCGRLGLAVQGFRALNCIIYHNHGAAGPNHFAMSVDYSCTIPLPPQGWGNIADDPQLAGDYHLSAESPCVGTGQAGSHSFGDIDGQPWPNMPCMGADQLTPGNATGELVVALNVLSTNVAVGYSVAMKVHVDGQTLGNRWNFGDGTGLSNQLEAAHAWSTPGVYDVRLTAFNDDYPDGISSTVRVHVVNAPASYVNAANLTPVFPYSAWATAAPSIQEAIAAGTVAGRVVWVTNGNYNTGGVAVHDQLRSRVALTNAVIVQSVNGPGATMIERQSWETATRCAWVGAGSILSGLRSPMAKQA